ncbi:MAG: hypothetical protein AAB610_00480 [Patescibacteria group bacterium]
MKPFFGTLSVIIAIISFVPYIKDVLARKTTPHIYSWLVWTILQALATIAILKENPWWSGLGVGSVGLVSLVVFLFSFKYGTKNITIFDTVCLIGALAAISVWIFIHDITLSVILVTIIDFVAFLPTFRKAYQEPHSETIILYVCSGLSNIFSLLSISHHSVSSTLYVASLIVTNFLFVGLVLMRRKK